MSDIDPVLDEVFNHLSREPFFCGYRLAQLREEHGQTVEEQAAVLGISLDRLMFLALSRMPQNRPDLEAIAWQLMIETGRLADVLGGPPVA